MSSYVIRKKDSVLTTLGPSSIVSFNDNLEEAPINSLIANIEPVQDLHGYDNPWPAGGNAQLLDIPDAPETTRNGVTYRIENGVIYANGTCTDGFSPFTDIRVEFPSGTYTFSAQLLSGSIAGVNNSFNGFDSGNNRTWLVPFGSGALPVKITETADIRRIGAAFNSGAVFNNAAIAFQVEAGSEMSAFRPYSNICSITGWTRAKVTRTGKNLLPNVIEDSVTKNGITVDSLGNGEFHIYGTTAQGVYSYVYLTLEDPIVIKDLWYFHCNNSASYGNTKIAISLRTAKRVLIRDVWMNNENTTAQISQECVGEELASIMFATPPNMSIDYTCKLMMSASADDEFVPYQGETYDITFPSEAGTVYGGTLTINADGDGELVVNRVMVTIDGTGIGKENVGWSTWEYVYYARIAQRGKQPSTEAVPNILSNQMVAGSYTQLRNADRTGIITFTGLGDYLEWASSAATLAEEQARLSASPMQAVYELAEHITYTLTAEQISLLTGVNTLQANTGNITVKYNKKLSTPTPGNLRNIVHLTNEQFDSLQENGSITSNNQTLTYNNYDLYITPNKEVNTTYSLTQDTEDGHKLIFKDSNDRITNITIPDNDTTYQSKNASNGGIDVSLVTTGEKYIWNSKTSNTGTVTSITPGNGLISGTSGSAQTAITTSGTISIGEGKVTNAMLAGSIANGKLANSSIKIGSKTINLGDTVSLSDIGVSYPVTGVKGNAENTYRTGNVNLTAANVGAVATSGNETVSDTKTLKFTSRVYPLVKSQEHSKTGWYKITFPYSKATTTTSAHWYMNSFDLHFGGGFNANPSGLGHIVFYWTRAAENGAWSASQVSAKIEGILVYKIKLYYRITEPGVLYVYNQSNAYNGILLDNLYVDDTSASLNWSTTTIETCDAITINDYILVPTVYTYSGNNEAKYYIGNDTTISGTLSATSFSGSGASLTNLNASNISSGTVPIARIQDASTSQKGVVQLSSATNSTSTSLAATASAVKSAYDLAAGKVSKSGDDMTGDLGIIFGDTDKFIHFKYNTSSLINNSWRLGILGTGSNDANYFVIQSGGVNNSTNSTWNNAIRIGQQTYDVAFGGNAYPLINDSKTLGTASNKWANVYATTFTGNLIGNVTGNLSGIATKATGDADGNTITTTYAKLASPTFTGTPKSVTPSSSSDSKMIATKEYVDNAFAANDAMIFKGTIGSSGATVTTLPATHNAGWTYRVITAGTYAGIKCEIGDLIICITDGTADNNAHWTVAQTNIDGAVIGPASSTENNLVLFGGTNGKSIKDSGVTLNTSSGSTTKWLTEKGTWTTPTAANVGAVAASAGVTAVTWDSINKKLIRTINGTTADVVTIATIKTALGLAKADVGLGSVTNHAQVTSLQWDTTNKKLTYKVSEGTATNLLTFAAGSNISLTADTNKITIANTYSYLLPLAANGTRGGVQIGYTTDATNRNYAVQLSSEKMYVNVPWTNTTYPIDSKTIDNNFPTAFRTQTKGDVNHGWYISTIRNDTASVENSPQYGSGLAWGQNDTHGYLYTSYNANAAYIGGGNADKLNWTAKLALIASTITSGQIMIADGTTGKIKTSGYTIATSVPSGAVFTDTKNTAGSTNSTSKLYLIGATTQAESPTTNSYQYTYTNNGLLSALKLGLNLNGTEKARLEWNNTDQSIDFVFN